MAIDRGREQDDTVAAAPLPEPPEVDWIPVKRWDSRAGELAADITAINGIIALMEGTADIHVCQVFIAFLQAAKLTAQQDLAMAVLGAHDVEIPDPGAMQTPQERLSAQLKHVADEVRQRRDLVPDKQPFTERKGARRGTQPPPAES